MAATDNILCMKISLNWHCNALNSVCECSMTHVFILFFTKSPITFCYMITNILQYLAKNTGHRNTPSPGETFSFAPLFVRPGGGE